MTLFYNQNLSDDAVLCMIRTPCQTAPGRGSRIADCGLQDDQSYSAFTIERHLKSLNESFRRNETTTRQPSSIRNPRVPIRNRRVRNQLARPLRRAPGGDSQIDSGVSRT